MALGASLSLSKDCATDVDTNLASYALRAADLGKSIFSVAGITLPAEKKFTASHEVGKNNEQRHLARLDRTEVDAFGVAATVSTYIVQVRPSNTAITSAICLEEVNRLVDFLIEGGSNGNWTSMLNNEV